MDIHSLDKAVQHYYSAALAPSTKKTYKAAEKRYLDFCKSFSITPLPTSENILCYYTACLGQQGLSHNTIKTYLPGVRQLQIAHGFPDTTIDHMPRLRQILKGVKSRKIRKTYTLSSAHYSLHSQENEKSMVRRGSQPLQPINAVGSRNDNILLLLSFRRDHHST